MVNFLNVYHALLNRPCFIKFPYHCEQDCVTQAATLVAPYATDGSGHDTEGALAEEATKAVVVLNRLRIGEAPKGSGASGGSAGPSI